MNKLSYIDDCNNKVQQILDNDFGDFKRKVGKYLNDLEISLSSENADIRTILHTLKQDVVYCPIRDVNLNFEKIKTTLNTIKNKL